MKKVLLFLLTFLLVTSLVGCGKKTSDGSGSTDSAKKVSLKVWASQDDQEFMNKRIDEFKKAHPETEWDIQLGVVGEPDAKTKVLEDPTAAADVFAFPNDQLRDLVKAGALYKITRPEDLKYIKDENAGADAFTLDGVVYGYPFSNDNGFFLYYDSRVFTKDDVATLDGMLKKAAEKNKKVFMDLSNGWYIVSFFLGNGGKLALENDKKVVDFNNEKGVQAGEAIKAFAANPAFTTGDDNILKAGFTDGTIAAGVSGTWNAGDIQKALGDGYAAAKLPTFTAGDKQVQMSSFYGCKGYGISSQTKYPVQAMDLAMFLTNEDSQTLRYEMRKTGPSNLKVAGSDKVKADVALSALLEQNKHAFSQNDVTGSYWNPAEAFGTAMENKDYSKTTQQYLDEMVKQIQTAQ